MEYPLRQMVDRVGGVTRAFSLKGLILFSVPLMFILLKLTNDLGA